MAQFRMLKAMGLEGMALRLAARALVAKSQPHSCVARHRRMATPSRSCCGSAYYGYDPFNRRIVRNALGLDRRYVYDGWRELEERTVSGGSTSDYLLTVRGEGLDEIVAVYRKESGAWVGRTVFQDHLGSVAEMRDAGGSRVERAEYDPYGSSLFYVGSSTTATYGSSVGNPWEFTGGRRDGETGMLYLRNRYMNVWWGRFATIDPQGNFGDAANLGNGYAYVGNAAVGSKDPFGLLTIGPGHGHGGGGSRSFHVGDGPGMVCPGDGDATAGSQAQAGQDSNNRVCSGSAPESATMPSTDDPGWLASLFGGLGRAVGAVASAPIAAVAGGVAEITGGSFSQTAGSIIEGGSSIVGSVTQTVGQAGDGAVSTVAAVAGTIGEGVIDIATGHPNGAAEVASGLLNATTLPIQIPINAVQGAIYGSPTLEKVADGDVTYGFVSVFGCQRGRKNHCQYGDGGAYTLPGTITFLSDPSDVGYDGWPLEIHEPNHIPQTLLMGPLFYPIALFDVIATEIGGGHGTLLILDPSLPRNMPARFK